MGPLGSHYLGAMYHCSKDSIVMHLDGDDEIVGRNSLQIFN